MLLTKIIRIRYLLILFVIVFALTRFIYLGPDSINPDAVNWHYRSQQFFVALKSGNFVETYQHYHPGVTLMWIMGLPIELVKQVYPEHQFYNHENFMLFHTISKYTLVTVQLLLTLALIYVLFVVYSRKKRPNAAIASILAVSAFTFEPFFTGNSRLLHMDVLLSLFLILGLLLFYLYLDSKRYLYGVASGIVLALAFLTKSIAVGALPFTLFMGIWWLYKEVNKKTLVKLILVLFLSYVATLFILFPALWVAPFATLLNIFSEAERIGISRGHGQILFGEYTENAGLGFYPLVLFLKLTPFTLLGILLYLVSRYRNINLKNIVSKVKLSPEVFLAVFYIGYFLVMLYSSKKLDRYMIPLFPFFGIIVYWGYYALLHKFPLKLAILVTTLVFGVFVAMPLALYHPYTFTYSTPLVAGSQNAHRLLAQKPFGIGISALKEFIFEKYGDYPTLGFIDTKPMGTIYMNSRLFDIRVDSTSKYDLIVLAPDEMFPENVLESEDKFKLDATFHINGLDYWRIYVKEK